MPIFRKNGKLIYFAHIPKTGGMSVAEFMEDFADSTGFIFIGQWAQAPWTRWSSTSPQHINAKNLRELFPGDFFDHSFAIIRHPEDRVVSEYKYRQNRNAVHKALPFSDWLEVVLAATSRNPFVFDSHLLPQTDFILPETRLFKLEDGFEDLAKWLSGVLEVEPSSVKFDVHANKSIEAKVRLTRQDRRRINEFFSKDFEQLGYEKRSEHELENDSWLMPLRRGFARSFSSLATRILSQRIPY